MSNPSPRILIYGVGRIAGHVIRILADRGWPIVGAVNRAGPKIGQDIGLLAGIGPMGVIVQDAATADLAAMNADIALVIAGDRLADNMAAYESVLGAGIDMICHSGEAYLPRAADPARAERIDTLALANGATFTGTGIWDFSRLWSAIALAGPMTQITGLFHRTLTNAEAPGTTLMAICGAGLPPAEFAALGMPRMAGIWKLAPLHVVHALGLTVTDVSERVEPVVEDKPVFSRALDRTLAPGTCLGTRVITRIETQEGVVTDAHTELRILPEGEVEHMAWTIEGRPRSTIRVDRTDPAYMTAACVVGRIQDVIAASPGIRLVSELRPMRWQGRFGA